MGAWMAGWKDDWVGEILANRKAGLERESEREGKKTQVLPIIKRFFICTIEKSLKLQDQAVTQR